MCTQHNRPILWREVDSVVMSKFPNACSSNAGSAATLSDEGKMVSVMFLPPAARFTRLFELSKQRIYRHWRQRNVLPILQSRLT